MPDCCAAANCKQSTDQSNISFFRFPLDPERCRQWVGNCRRPDLQAKSPEYLHRNFKLCSRHFEASMIQRESELKTILKDGAIPTMFDFTANKERVQYSNRKRSRQPAAEDLVEAKKPKDEPQTAAVIANVKEPGDNPETQDVVQDDAEKEEDPVTSKAKEILKVYFKETLAFTGFSIGNSAAGNATKSLGGGAVGQLGANPVCAEKIEIKDVLKLGEDVMWEEIRNSLRLARFFSIVLQDKTNIEGKDQIPVFVRSMSCDGFPQKHLMGFLPCDLDSDSLFLMLVSEIRNKWGLRMEHCRGFTYLTTGSLCQKLKDLSCRMLRDFSQVVLAPCDPYAFNLWLIRSLPVLSVQEVMDTVEEVAAILRQSATLQKKLHAKIASAYGHIKGEVDRVKEASQNNWEYGTDAFQTMLDILEPLLHSIGEMCTSSLSAVDTAIVEQLLKLKDKLKNFNFIVTLVVLKNTLCCVSILNPSLKGIISISSTLQYTISNALKLLNKHLQEIPIFHRKWFSDAVGRAKKLGVAVTLPADTTTNGDAGEPPQPSPEDYYREKLSKMILQYLIDEVKRVLGTEMVRILRWLSLVPSYMADHNFSIRKDKVADANLNNLARPDSFYDELGCWEVKWRHASKRRILPTSVFATLKIPDIGFYPNVQSLLRVLGSIPCINAGAEVYGEYDMVLDRYKSYMKEVPAENRRCNMAFVYVNQDVHFNIDDMVQSYVEGHPDILQLLQRDDAMEVNSSATENNASSAAKEDLEEPREMTLNMELETQKPADCAETDKEALKSALQAAVTSAFNSQSGQAQGGQEGEVEYVTKSEMNEVLKVCEEVVREGILSEVGGSFFSLFVDRAVKFGETDLLPLFLRFVDSFDVMRLELMGFVDVNLDTEDMCERLFDLVTKEWGLDLKLCRGQAYLGSGEVSYKLKAFACKVQEKYPLAICTHCSCYSFNTWWSRSVPVPSVSRVLDILENVVLFFSSSPDLEKELDHVLAVGLRESYEKLHELQGNFCSSWLEKHDSYDVFGQILEPLADCLDRMQSDTPQSWSLAVSNQAKKLLQLIRDFDFIVAIVALKNVSSFTRELSAALQKDHYSAASQFCQISGIVATLNRVKTNIKVFHQNWFDEACAFAQSLGVQIKVPDNVTVVRDNLLKPNGYYKDAVSGPLLDHLINSIKDYFSDDHKEALNFLSLVPCSVTMSYTFESLKSKPPLYVGDLPDPDNFLTELSCWKVKWKTKVVSPSMPDSIFQTLRLPLMQYFANINTLLKIMCVLPSTALEYSGEIMRHKMFQEYLRNTHAKDRSPCLAMLQVATNFNRDLDRMVAQCLKVTPKTLEGISLTKESKTLLRNSEVKAEEDNHKDDVEEMEVQQIFSQNKAQNEIFPEKKQDESLTGRAEAVGMETQQVLEASVADVVMEEEQGKPLDENGHSVQPADSLQSCKKVFRVAAYLARKNCMFSEISKEERDSIIQELSMCHWDQGGVKCFSEEETLESIATSIRETVLFEVQESPFFSIITDKLVSVDDKRYIPVFVRYVADCTPKVELLGFLPFDCSSDVDTLAKTLSDVLSEDWGLQMGYCRGQSFMCMGAGNESLRKLSLDILASYPLAVSTPSESCGLACWLSVSLQNEPITKVLGVVEDLLLFFDQSPKLHIELSQTMEGLLNTPREALAEVPETCLSRWKKAEDFFDILVDMLDGVLSCLDSVSNNTNGSWSNSMSIHALILSTAIRETDFVIPLVILKNACAPLRNCSTVFRCGNPADIICELERIPLIIESLNKTLENIGAVHATWFEEATRLAAKVSGALSYTETVGSYDSPDVGYRETVSVPVVSGLIEAMKFNFSESHLRALRVLSLLPTCNPMPILPEATDKLYTIYQNDLPEPDVVEEEINTWATVWREKYQETAPPASISETLHHPEAKGHPNVTTLLKLVAVLPSISMECDLMKTTLNSLRTFLRDEIDVKGSKNNAVMLLMHCRVLRTLKEVIDRCMESDPESHGLLSQVKQIVCNLKVDSDELGSGEITPGGSEEVKDDGPFETQDQLNATTQSCIIESTLEGALVTPNDIIATDVYSDPERTQTSIEVQLSTEKSLSTEEPEAAVQGTTADIVTAPQIVTLDISAAMLAVNTENATGVQSVSPEPVKTTEDATLEITQGDSVELVTAQTITDMEAKSQEVTTQSESAVENVTTEFTNVPQVVIMELVSGTAIQTVSVTQTTEQSVSTGTFAGTNDDTVEQQAASSADNMEVESETPELAVQNITTDLTAAAYSSHQELPSPLTELAPKVFTTEPVPVPEAINRQLITEIANQGFSTADKDVAMEPAAVTQSEQMELGTETTHQSVTTEPVPQVAVQSVPTDSVADVTIEHTDAAQGVATEPLSQMAVHSVTTVSVTAPEDVAMELGVVQGVPTEPDTAPEHVTLELAAAQGVPTEPGTAPEHVTLELAAAQGVPTEPGTAPEHVTLELAAAQGVPTEPGTAPEHVTLELSAAQGVHTEPGTAPEHVTLELAAAQGVHTEPGTAPEHVTLELAAAQGVHTEPGTAPEHVTLELAAAQDVPTEPDTSPEDVAMEIAAAQGHTAEVVKAPEHVTLELAAAQDVPTEPDAAPEHVTLELAAAQGVHTEPDAAPEHVTLELAAAQGVHTEPDAAPEHVTLALAPAQSVPTEPDTAPEDVAMELAAAQGHTAEAVKAPEHVTLELAAAQDVPTEPDTAPEHVTLALAPAQGVPTEPDTAPEDVAMELAAAQGHTAEAVKAPEDVRIDLAAAQAVITEAVVAPEDVTMELAASSTITTESVTAPEDVALELMAAVAQGGTTEPVIAPKEVTVEPTGAAQCVASETQMVLQTVTTDYVGTSKNFTMETSQGATTEEITAPEDVTMEIVAAAQCVTTECVTQMAVSTDSVVAPKNVTQELPAQSVITELVTAPEDATVEAAQGMTTEHVTKLAVESVPTDSVAAPKDFTVEIMAAVQDVTTDPETQIAVHGVPTDSAAGPKDDTMELGVEAAEQGNPTDSVAGPKDDSMELGESANSVTTEPITQMAVQGVPTDSVEALKDDSVELAAEAAVQAVTTDSVAAPERNTVAIAAVAQTVTTETVTAPEDIMELTASAQGVTTEPANELGVRGVPTDSVTAPRDVVAELPLIATQGFTTAPLTQMVVQSVPADSVAAPNDVTGAFPTAAIQGVATEPITQTAVHAITTDFAAAPRDILMEFATAAAAAAAQCVSTRPVTEAQALSECISAESVTAVQDITKEQITTEHSVIGEPVSKGQEVSIKATTAATQPFASESIAADPDIQGHVISSQDVSMEVVTDFHDSVEPIKEQGVAMSTAAQVVPKEPTTSVQDWTIKSVTSDRVERIDLVAAVDTAAKEPAFEVKNVADEHVPEILNTCTEPRIEQHVNSETVTSDLAVSFESTADYQDMAVEPTAKTQCVSLKPTLKDESHSTSDIPVSEITIKPAAGAQKDYVEPSTAVKDSTESSTEVTRGKVAECIAMELTETAVDVSEPIAMSHSVTTESSVAVVDVQMEPSSESPNVSVESAAVVQDIVMESVTETQCESTKSIVVVQDVPAENKAVQDVVMEPLPEIEDISMDATDVQELLTDPKQSQAESITAIQYTDLKTEIHDVTNQVLVPGNGATSPFRISALNDCDNANSANSIDQSKIFSQNCADKAVTVVQASSQCITDNSSTEPTEDIIHKGEITDQDDVAQSSAVDKDCSGHPDTVTQALDYHQTSVAAHTSAVPQKVLSFYEIHAQETLCKELANVRFFSIVFEQQVEIDGRPYIPVGVCYLDKHNTLNEDILAFVPLGKDITTFVDAVIEALCTKWGLNLAFCQGQSLLTLGNAAVQVRGAVSLLSQTYPKAVRTLNSSVSLNTWLAWSCAVTQVADCFTWVEKLLHWFSDGTERLSKLQNRIASLFQLDEKRHCELREKLNKQQWERSHDVLEFTVEALEAFMLCLKEMKENDDNQAEKTQAVNFLCIFQDFKFILTVVIMKNILSLTNNVSQSLQGEPLNVCHVVNSLPDLLSSLKEMTVNTDSLLQTWFQEAVTLATRLEISDHCTLQEPLIAHYRGVIKSAIEHSVRELTELLSSRVLSVLCCMQVVPYVISRIEGCCKDTDLFRVFQDELPDWSGLQTELQRWRDKWLDTTLASQQILPASVEDAHKVSDISSFPNIETILRLLMVAPCYRREGSVRQGKKNLREFNRRSQRSLPELYPL